MKEYTSPIVKILKLMKYILFVENSIYLTSSNIDKENKK